MRARFKLEIDLDNADFTDEQIAEMDSNALEFWKQWKSPLLAMCKAHKPEELP